MEAHRNQPECGVVAEPEAEQDEQEKKIKLQYPLYYGVWCQIKPKRKEFASTATHTHQPKTEWKREILD